MAKKNDQKTDESYLMNGVDPEVEAKVDALMSQEALPKPIAEPEKLKQNEETVDASAPLLPGDKLPDFDQKPTPKTPAVEPEKIEPIEIKDTKPLGDEIGIEDPSTNEAVDEIIAEESGRALAIEDAKAELAAGGLTAKHQSLLSKLKSKIADFWANPRARMATLGILFIGILVISVVPTTRYFTLNLIGVRASTSIKVIDEKTGQPLKNVDVSIDGRTSKTDKEGHAKIEKIKLGSQELLAKKPAFAEKNQKITVGLGSNPLGDMRLTAVGSQYTFNVVDFLSKSPVEGAEAVSGEASAVANEKGEIVLVVDDEKEGNVEVEINSDKYRTEKVSLAVGEKSVQNLELVPSRKQAFVSKRSGKYDLYKIDVDGKNEERVFAGTGSEKADGMIIMHHPTKDVIAFVSTRGDKYNKDGFALSSLNIIDLKTNEATKIAQSERVQLIDFIDDRLVFVKITEGASEANTNRHKLISYNVESAEEKELASTNYFNDVISADGLIYYAPAIYQVNGPVGFFRIKPDGTDKYQVFGEEVWNLFRVSYHKIAASVQQSWYEYDTGTKQFNRSGGAPATQKTRVYADSPDKKRSAWVDERDGKGVLLIYSSETNEEDKVVKNQSGLRNPIRWLDDDHLVYRVTNNSETADYVISLSGGEAKKIIDVTDTAGLDRWYYY